MGRSLLLLLSLATVVAQAQIIDPEVGEDLPVGGLDFADGFESGLTGWTAQTGPGGSVALDGGVVWDGQRSLTASLSGSTESGEAFVEKALTPVDAGTVYLRGFLYVPGETLTALEPGARLRVLEASGAPAGFGGGLEGESSTAAVIVPRVGGSELSAAVPVRLTPDTWHRVEVGYDLEAQEAQFFLDDVAQPRAQQTANLTLPLLTALRAGLISLPAGVSAQVHLDNVALVSGRPEGTRRSINQLHQGFEAGGLTTTDATPGKGGELRVSGALALTATAGSARRVADLGLELVDSETISLAQQGALVGALSPGADQVYLRFWWRQAALTTAGERQLASLLFRNTSGEEQPFLTLSRLDTPHLVLTATTDFVDIVELGRLTTSPDTAPAWHLVEVLATGLRTSGGHVKAWLDGVLFADDPVAISSVDVTGWALGQLNGGVPYAGTDSIDDVRIARAAQPDRFGFVGPVRFDRGLCGALTIQALTAEGTRARVPDPAPLKLTQSGASDATAGFFHDAACGVRFEDDDVFPAGVASLTVYVRLIDPGTAVDLTVSSSDYLSGQAEAALLDPGTLPPVTNLVATPNPAGPGLVDVTWTGPSVPNFLHYGVVRSFNSVSDSASVTTPLFQFDPSPGETTIGVRVYDTGGAYSPEVTVSVLADETPPPTPRAPLVVWKAEAEQAVISWSPVDDGETATASYELIVTTPVGEERLSAIDDTTAAFPVTDPGEYGFALIAIDAVGNESAAGPARTEQLPPAAAPAVITQPNGTGVVGIPYRVSASGRVEATSDAPVTWAACDTPPAGFFIAPETGFVSWLPDAAGEIPICVSATNEEGPTFLRFLVRVAATATEVHAALRMSPGTASAPAQVTLDASESITSGEVLAYRWSFGDGARAETNSPTVEHQYLLPGGYRGRVTVVDAQGIESEATAFVAVVAEDGREPPIAKIHPSFTRAEGEVTVTFSCDCDGGPILAYAWDTGDGGSGVEETKTHTFGPGRHLVRLVVVNEAGLASSDVAEVVVTEDGREPPYCAPSATPTSGPAPLTVTHVANASATMSPIADIEWSTGAFIGSGEQLTHTYSEPRWHSVAARVTAEDGLTCRGTIPIAASSVEGDLPPVIFNVTQNAEAICGQLLDYQPAAIVPADHTWSLENAPAGMSVDPADGTITWTPEPWQAGTDGGLYAVSVVLTSGSSVARQTLNLDVSCSSAELTTCGCGATGGATPALAFSLLLLARWRRSRWRARHERGG